MAYLPTRIFHRYCQEYYYFIDHHAFSHNELKYGQWCRLSRTDRWVAFVASSTANGSWRHERRRCDRLHLFTNMYLKIICIKK